MVDGFTKVGFLRKKNIKNLSFCHLNRNSLRNKTLRFLNLWQEIISKYCCSVKQDMILVFRSLDLQFPVINYFVKTEINMEEVWVFIWPRILLTNFLINAFCFPNSFEVLPLEINFRNRKKLVVGCCKPPSLNCKYILDQLNGIFIALDMIIFFCWVMLISPKPFSSRQF